MDAVVDVLRAVEVAEGDVVDAVKDARRDMGDAADVDVAFAVAGGSAGDERVGEDHGAGSGRVGGEVGPDEIHGRGGHCLVRGFVGAEVRAGQGRF